MEEKESTRYRIKLTVAVYKDRTLVHKNDMVVPTVYSRRSEARTHIENEKRDRLRGDHFFLSPRADYDLVRYADEATRNTYIRYRIVEERPFEFPVEKKESPISEALSRLI